MLTNVNIKWEIQTDGFNHAKFYSSDVKLMGKNLHENPG